jgi:hypothetical protein
MGIFRLTSFVNSKFDFSGYLSLNELARENPDQQLEILVDGNGLVHLVAEDVMYDKGLAGWEWVLGGEYAAMDAALRAKIQAMQRAGLKIVACFDAAKGMKSGSVNDWKKHEDKKR